MRLVKRFLQHFLINAPKEGVCDLTLGRNDNGIGQYTLIIAQALRQ